MKDKETAATIGNNESTLGEPSEILEGINRVESRLQDLENRLLSIESEVRDDPEVKHLANEVFKLLPTEDEIVEFERTVQKVGAKPPELPGSNAGTIQSFANRLDVEEYRIEDALEQLQQDTHQVHTMTLNETVEGWSHRPRGRNHPILQGAIRYERLY